MEHNDLNANINERTAFCKEISELIHERFLFSESISADLPIGIEVYDSDGILRSINNYALKMYGIEDRMTVLNIVNLFKSPYVNEALLEKIKRGENITLEFEYDFERINRDSYFKSKNKNSMIYEAKIIPIRNKKGDIIGHTLLANDVTAVKEAEFRTEETKKNLELAMDATHMSSWVYHIENDVFSSLYGTPVAGDHMSMEDIIELLHPHDRDMVKQLFARLIDGKIQYGQVTLRIYNKNEKQYRYYESRMRLSFEDIGRLEIVGTELDVTDKIRLEKEAQDLLAKRELTMKVCNIVHWDFDVRTRKFESYNDPLNDYKSSRLLTIEEYIKNIHPEDIAVFSEAVRSMQEGKDYTNNFTCRLQTKYDDAWQYCDFTSVPFEWDEKGNVIRFTGFRQNIPQLQKLNRELRDRSNKIELSFKTVGMSYWDFDVNSKKFRAFNDPVNDYQSQKIFAPDEYLNVGHPDDHENLSKSFEHMLQGVDHDFSFSYRSKTKWDKDWQILVVTGIPAERNKDGRCIRYTGLTVNNTKREKMIQELKELKEKAELSDKLKSAFLANMSHEIRTPLNAIVGFSQLLLECEDKEEKEKYVDIIQSNNELLLRLVNDILDLSKIESGVVDLKKEQFDLAKVAHELFTIAKSKNTNPEVTLHLDNPMQECWVTLDKNRLQQVWTNFLTNALKFIKSGYIKMGYAIEETGVRLYVEDSGIGIPEEMHDKVFTRFQKFNDFVQGTGLGLAISKAIVEAIGGKIGFSSVAGKGSTFWAWFPCM